MIFLLLPALASLGFGIIFIFVGLEFVNGRDPSQGYAWLGVGLVFCAVGGLTPLLGGPLIEMFSP